VKGGAKATKTNDVWLLWIFLDLTSFAGLEYLEPLSMIRVQTFATNPCRLC